MRQSAGAERQLPSFRISNEGGTGERDGRCFLLHAQVKARRSGFAKRGAAISPRLVLA
jgi:hypothetical protein